MWVLLGSLTSAQHPHLNDLQEANVSPIKASKWGKKILKIANLKYYCPEMVSEFQNLGVYGFWSN